MRLAILPGTNRRGSLSLALAKLLAPEYAALGCEVDLMELALGPEFLEPEAYKQPKPAVKTLVDRFLSCDAALIIVPEYNGSYPGILKLFIDMLPDKVSFDHRPCAYIGVAAGAFHGLRAVEHLQAVAGYRHAHNYPVRVFIGNSMKAFTPEGPLVDTKLWERLQAQAKGFVRFARQVKRDGDGDGAANG
jgi:chromate reductase